MTVLSLAVKKGLQEAFRGQNALAVVTVNSSKTANEEDN